jgi:hypothetical protein
MNLLEQYIVEIYTVEPYEAEWTSKFPDRKFVKVNMKTTCYGRDQRQDHVFNTEEWSKIKEQGYYMG